MDLHPLSNSGNRSAARRTALNWKGMTSSANERLWTLGMRLHLIVASPVSSLPARLAMTTPFNRVRLLGLGVFCVSAIPFVTLPAQRFEVVVSRGAHAEPITGRVYVAVTRTPGPRSPIDQTGETGAPLFGVNVDALAPGTSAVIDATAFGHRSRVCATCRAASTGCSPL
jgi:hypothetical protein